jgi:Zn-dependent protease with chaperone function
MSSGTRVLSILVACAAAVPCAAATSKAQKIPKTEKVEKVEPKIDLKGPKAEIKGWAEFRKGDIVIVDGQRVRLAPKVKLKGVPDAQSLELGYEVKAKGIMQADGSLYAQQLEAKPNKLEDSEQKLHAQCNEIEALYTRAGRALRVTRDGSVQSLGSIAEKGSDHRRARKILDRLLPPYVQPNDVRLYVVDNKEWNAFAMANYAIYIHTGLLNDMDDDEVAIVLGHELAHATMEHTRRTMRKGRWARLGATVAAVGGAVVGGIGGDAIATLGGLGASAVNNGFSRGFEDEADRVGTRYAYEGGFRADKAPALWQRFGEKYKDGGAVGNFLFGSHSSSKERAKNLEVEVARNYGQGVDDKPSRK